MLISIQSLKIAIIVIVCSILTLAFIAIIVVVCSILTLAFSPVFLILVQPLLILQEQLDAIPVLFMCFFFLKVTELVTHNLLKFKL